MEKKTHTVPIKDIYHLLCYGDEKLSDYVIIEDEITASDPEDGGADHELVIQHKVTKKFYSLSYQDWDLSNFEYDVKTDKCRRCDMNNEVYEVFPKQVIKTIYTRVN